MTAVRSREPGPPPAPRRPRAGLAALLALALASAWLSTSAHGRLAAAPAAVRPWTEVHNWAFWRDRPDPAQLGASAYELVVMDYSADQTAAGEFTPAQIGALRSGACARRVVAYVGVGMAESYRFYWDPAWAPGSPAWILAEDPDWPGHYAIEFWDPAWRAVLFRYLDRVLAQGFDGVYLDTIDVYPDVPGHEQDMVDLVRALAEYARARSPLGEDFGVFAHNAEELASRHPEYVAVLTGLGKEETYFVATDLATTATARAAAQAHLDVVRQGSRGHLALTVDYATTPQNVAQAYDLARARGYVPYAADATLDRLRINPGFEPTCSPPVTPT
jgi:cysteinyl-tRNA synthetase